MSNKHLAHANVNQLHDDSLTFGQRVSDTVAATLGSWRFIIIQSIVLAAWIVLNTLAFTFHWDSYPYILLNLALSFEAAFSAPVIMMSQNRQASKDRLAAEADYHTNLAAKAEVEAILHHLEELDLKLIEQHKVQLSMLKSIEDGVRQRAGTRKA